MRIDGYSFGKITIDGHVYTNDVIVYPERVATPWRRARGHELSLADIGDIILRPVETLVIGTGSSGRMRVPDETLEEIKKHFANVVLARTGEAVEIYNRKVGVTLIVAALHLTC